MVNEVLSFLKPRPGGLYIDCTVGLGGHSKAIVESAGGGVKLLCIDKDPTALRLAEQNLASLAADFRYVQADFGQLDRILDEQGIDRADGVLFDFGVSSLQLDEPERGFSYLHDSPLDMRMDPTKGITAAELINTRSAQELTEIIRDYGEERWAARIAKFIVEHRQRRQILTADQLVQVIKNAIPARARRSGPHPARRTFQALRIAVNDELTSIETGLVAGIGRLKPGGVLCAISFHSLEDRIVKRVFNDAAREQKAQRLTKRPVAPTPEEIETNPRSRSAKLRAVSGVLKPGEVE